MILIFASSIHAEESMAASPPEYNLSVSFDIEASKIFGHAQIHARAGSELTIHTNGLKIIKAIDEDLDLFRMPAPEEAPPTLARLASEDNKIVVMPPKRKGMYAEIVDVFNEKGKDIELAYIKSGIAPRKLYSENDRKRRLRVPKKNGDRKKRFFSKEMTEINDEAIKDSSLVVLGAYNPLIEKLFGKTEFAKDSGSTLSVDIKKNPRNPEKVVAIINVSERKKTAAAFKEIFEYPFNSSYSLKD